MFIFFLLQNKKPRDGKISAPCLQEYKDRFIQTGTMHSAKIYTKRLFSSFCVAFFFLLRKRNRLSVLIQTTNPPPPATTTLEELITISFFSDSCYLLAPLFFDCCYKIITFHTSFVALPCFCIFPLFM
jgi:hypothetical protein